MALYSVASRSILPGMSWAEGGPPIAGDAAAAIRTRAVRATKLGAMTLLSFGPHALSIAQEACGSDLADGSCPGRAPGGSQDHHTLMYRADLCSRDGPAAWERFTLNAVVQHVVISMPRNEASPEMKHLLIILVLVLALGAASGALAQPPMLDEVDAADLIGGTVQSAVGIEVGEVCAITLKQDGEVTEVRMTTERMLGVGERTVILPKDSYIVLRGTIVLHLSLEEIRQLPAEPVAASECNRAM